MMTRRRGLSFLTALVVAGGTSACALPSDLSDEFSIAADTRDLVLTVGDTIRLAAHLVRGTDTVPGLPIEYISNDPTVAIVEGDGLLRAAGVGFAEVLIRAAGLQNATSATRTVRVLRDVTIDTVMATETSSPDGRTVRWGEIIELRGVGLDPAFGNIVFVGGVPARLRSFQPGDPDDVESLDRLVVWVPVGAEEQSDVLVSRFGGSTAAWPVRVDQHDILEPPSAERVDLSFAGNPVYPELSIEVDARYQGECWSIWGGHNEACYGDGYRIEMPASGEMTVEFDTDRPLSGSNFTVELRGDVFGSTDPESYTMSADWSYCVKLGAAQFQVFQIAHPFSSQSRSIVFPFRGDPGHEFDFSHNVWSVGTSVSNVPLSAPQTSRYGVRLYDGYVSALPPDVAEENDHCWGAYPVEVDGPTVDLTFDHGRDLDWFSFTVTGASSPIDTEIDEVEPNSSSTQADTVALGTRIFGEIQSRQDVDYFAFYADAGQLLDIELLTDRLFGEATVDSFLQLWFGGEPIAFNDDISPSTGDSRITIAAPGTGWYTVSVQDLYSAVTLDETYELTIRALGDHVRLEATVTQTSALPDNEFVPVVQLLFDTRDQIGSPIMGRLGEGTLQELLLPGKYLLLVYNRAGVAGEYTLQLTDTR